MSKPVLAGIKPLVLSGSLGFWTYGCSPAADSVHTESLPEETSMSKDQDEKNAAQLRAQKERAKRLREKIGTVVNDAKEAEADGEDEESAREFVERRMREIDSEDTDESEQDH